MLKRWILAICAILSPTAMAQNTTLLRQQTFASHDYIVFKVEHLENLRLGLYDAKQKALNSFVSWQKYLPRCENMIFAMNAGMFHADYTAVGLYVEKQNMIFPLNTAEGQGNFFLKPNGVLAWNKQQAVVLSTQQWQKHMFQADYATQSGPMLVVDQKIPKMFLQDSNSRKIRNGVGIKDGQLYFVISQQRVNFYEFARFFQQGLEVEHALYLDGSISSIYAPALRRYDRAFKLGPMLAYIQHQPNC